MNDFDLGAMMRQAQQLQQQMAHVQKNLDDQDVEGSAGSGLVKVTATGGQRIKSIERKPEALEEDLEMIQDLVTTAVNNALEKSKALAQERMGSLLPPGMAGGLPGF